MLGRQVVHLGGVLVGVVELPAVVGEVAPAGDRRVDAHRLPALVPDRPRPQHREEPRLLGRRHVVALEGRAEAHALQRDLGEALDHLRQLHPDAVVDGGHQVGGVGELVPQLAPGLDLPGPGDDQRVGHAPLEVVALPHLERGVERPRPAHRVVVVGRRRAQLLEVLQILLDLVGDAVEELVLVDRPVGAALAAGAVVGDQHDDGVLELPGRLQEVEQPPDLVVGVGQEPGVDLGHPAEEPLLLLGQRVPGPDHVDRVPRLAVDARLLGIGVQRRQLGAVGEDAQLLLALEDLLAVAPRSPCRSGPCTSRSTPWGRGGAHGWRPGRST